MKSNVKKTIKTEIELAAQAGKKVRDSKETLAEVLTAIRQHEPEGQNDIMNGLIKELAIDRLNRYKSASQERDRSQNNLDHFVKTALGVEMFLKEHENGSNNLNQRPNYLD